MMNIYCVSSSIVDDKVVAMFSEHMNSYASNSKYSIEIIQCLGFSYKWTGKATFNAYSFRIHRKASYTIDSTMTKYTEGNKSRRMEK